MFSEWIKKIKEEYNFEDIDWSISVKEWPEIILTLTEQQVKKYKKYSENMDSIIFKCERAANDIEPLNAGIIGSTKYNFNYPNILKMKGSILTLELVIDNIFKNEV